MNQLRHADYSQLLRLARRRAFSETEAEDVLQEALVIAVRQGRSLSDRAWLSGVMRHVASSLNRSAGRFRRRETRRYLEATPDAPPEAEPNTVPHDFVVSLPVGLRLVLQLSLSGHGRDEIRYLLRLSDEALRQRLTQLRLRVRAAGLSLPDTGPAGGLHFGRIRQALRPVVRQAGEGFGSHDPDGHLFIIGVPHKTAVGGHNQT